jgi:hypothetical protein
MSVSTTISVLLIGAAVFFVGWQAKGQAPPPQQPFGGMVSMVEWCTCNEAIAVVTVGPPRGGRFLHHPTTEVYEYYQIPRTGVWLLGNYLPGVGVCLVYTAKGCDPIPHEGMISIVGTSQ